MAHSTLHGIRILIPWRSAEKKTDQVKLSSLLVYFIRYAEKCPYSSFPQVLLYAHPFLVSTQSLSFSSFLLTEEQLLTHAQAYHQVLHAVQHAFSLIQQSLPSQPLLHHAWLALQQKLSEIQHFHLSFMIGCLHSTHQRVQPYLERTLE